MKTKSLILFLCFFLSYSITSSAQSKSISTPKGSSLITGMLSFSSQGGNLYSGNFTSLSVSSKYHAFLINRLGLGISVSHGRIFSKGDNDFSSWSIGPHLRYFFDKGNSIVPYLGVGANLVNLKFDDSKDRIFRTNAGGGLAVFKNEFVMLYEVGFDFDRFKNDNGRVSNGYTFYISFGAAVSLFANKKD